MQNYELLYLKHIEIDAEEYDGYCHHLATETIDWLEELGFEAVFADIWSSPDQESGITPNEYVVKEDKSWRFHAVVISGGLVHDMWVDKPMKIDEYLDLMFGEQEVELRIGIPPEEIRQVWQGRQMKREYRNDQDY